MATPSFDEEAAERWYQSRAAARHADPQDPMARFRNNSRSMFIDTKNYTGGALRGAVSDRRAEWMGGGAGGRLGEDWRQHNPIDVDRLGSGLDPLSYWAAKKVRGGVDKRRMKKAAGRVLRDQATPAEETPAAEATTTPEASEPTVTPAKPKRTMSPEQRTKSNERRRALTAQRRDAVNILAAYSLQDESPGGPMWPSTTPETTLPETPELP